MFPYSERPGTAALKIEGRVDEKTKKQRSARLLALSEQKTHDFYQQYIGSCQLVLMEKAQRGRAMHGFTPNYIRVELPASLSRPELDNQLVMLRLVEFNHDRSALIAELMEDA